jgi:DGQHR domain-containing protein
MIIKNNQQYLTLPCLEAKQPIGNMYIAIIDADILEYISMADVRRLKDNREVEEYTGIQRKLSDSREREIGKYVNLIDATFPNSIILAISSENVSFNETEKTLTILYKDDVAKVLDGQHRIAGLNHFEKKGSEFQCIVTIYIDMELEDQAIVFATINTEQKPVSKSLAADLYEFAKTRSPQKTCHTIARVLDQEKESPFYQKIKILGNANDIEKETITQDTFVKGIMQYISKDPQADRQIYKHNKLFWGNKKPSYAEEKDSNKLILRKLFIDDESDIKIAQLIINYFQAVQFKWEYSWNNVVSNNILNKSTGFIALIKFFKDVCLYLRKSEDDVISKESFLNIFKKINIEDKSFTTEKYLPGAKGQSALYKELLLASGLNPMSNNSDICKKEHRYYSSFQELPESQEFYEQSVRHKCAGCAYDQGYEDAINGRVFGIRLLELNISQAGTVRHKDPKQAYELGYSDGLKNKK